MSDNVAVTAGTGTSVATDLIGERPESVGRLARGHRLRLRGFAIHYALLLTAGSGGRRAASITRAAP